MKIFNYAVPRREEGINVHYQRHTVVIVSFFKAKMLPKQSYGYSVETFCDQLACGWYTGQSDNSATHHAARNHRHSEFMSFSIVSWASLHRIAS